MSTVLYRDPTKESHIRYSVGACGKLQMCCCVIKKTSGQVRSSGDSVRHILLSCEIKLNRKASFILGYSSHSLKYANTFHNPEGYESTHNLENTVADSLRMSGFHMT